MLPAPLHQLGCDATVEVRLRGLWQARQLIICRPVSPSVGRDKTPLPCSRLLLVIQTETDRDADSSIVAMLSIAESIVASSFPFSRGKREAPWEESFPLQTLVGAPGRQGNPTALALPPSHASQPSQQSGIRPSLVSCPFFILVIRVWPARSLITLYLQQQDDEVLRSERVWPPSNQTTLIFAGLQSRPCHVSRMILQLNPTRDERDRGDVDR
jgi:hypothetical protein